MITKVLFLLLFITVSSQASGTIHLSQDEQDYLTNKKEITVCTNPKGLPLFAYKNGQHIGILVEIMFLMEKKLPVPIRFIPVKSWKECIDLNREKKVDISTIILTSPNKHRHLLPSYPIIDGAIGMATRIKESLLNHPTEMNHKKIALLQGQTSINYFLKQKFSNLNIVMVDSIEEGLMMVAKGKVYGYVDETYTLAYYILKLHSNELKIMERINKTPMHGSLGIRKDEPQLLNIMNKVIDSIDEQEIKDIIHDWISVRVEKDFDYVLLMQIVLFFLVILLVSLYWVRKLFKEVEKRKEVENKLKNFNENLEKDISLKIEEIRYKDAMLLEKTKLAAMGEMIGSIAHQWRRPLSTLHINVEMLEEDYKEQKIDQMFIDHFIKKNSEIIQYMSQTINDFQNFYKIDKEKKYFDVMEKIKALSELKLNQLEYHSIVLSIEGESFTVLGYPGEFQQVILSLISNAQDALVESGTENPWIKIILSTKGAKGYVRISDNAGGIDEKIIDKIFEPYFSTKEKSGGTGLGLYISKMIIENNMQGELSISSQGEGSEVLIVLSREENA